MLPVAMERLLDENTHLLTMLDQSQRINHTPVNINASTHAQLNPVL